MASIIDVAKAAGVGKSTVSRYVSGKGYVSEENRARIEEAIRKLRYVPSTSGRSLRLQRSYAMAICVPMITHPFFSRFAESLQTELFRLAEEGDGRLNKVIIVAQDEQRKLKWLIERRLIDGAFLVTHEKFDANEFGVPIVTVDRLMGREVPDVTSDNYEATLRALRYLYDKGRRSIGFIGGRPSQRSEVLRRYDAYCDFLEEKGLAPHLRYQDYRHGEEIEVAQRFLEEEKGLDAVLATSDAFAFAVYRTVREKGYGPIDIISYDGCMDAWIQRPVFTSIVQDIPGMARAALSLLLKKIGGESCPDCLVVPTKFRKGETA